MSYTDVCPGSGTEKIGHYSNPDVYYDGKPTGSANEDNARQISMAKIGAAKNRYRGMKSITAGKCRCLTCLI